MKKAYSYIRFSTPEQAKGRSQSRQLEECEKYCLANGLDLAREDEYTFLDAGKSAYKAEHLDVNGQLARFLSLVEDGTIQAGSYLVVESLDRLSRESVKRALPRFIDLLGKGINIVTLSDKKTYTSEYTEIDLILSILIMGRAHEESSIKAQRVGDAWRKKQDRARSDNEPMGNARPLWLDLEDGRYTPNEERASIVRRVFQMAIDGYGKRVIAKTLNSDGIASFKGMTWGSSSVQKLLSNKAVFGEYQPYTGRGKERQPRGDAIQNHYPAILDQSTFYQAQEATTGRRVAGATKQSERFNVWQGIAHCGLCSTRMHLVNKGKPPKGGTYLHCYKARKGLCEAKAIRLDQSELIFKEILAKVNSLSLVQSNSASIQKQLSEVDGRLAEKVENLALLKASLKARFTDTVNDLVFDGESEIAALTTEKEALLVTRAADTITDKEEFFARLDLESREGRYRANALLKRLKIIVGAGMRDKFPYCFVVQNGKMILAISFDSDGKIDSIPCNAEQMEKAKLQDFNGSAQSSMLLIHHELRLFVKENKKNLDEATLHAKIDELCGAYGFVD